MVFKSISKLLKEKQLLAYLNFRLCRVFNFFLGKVALAGFPISKNEKKLLSFRNRHKGKRVFILGNGPSVSTEDLERLSGEVVFAANRFYLAYDDIQMRPTYTCSVDPLMIKNHIEEIADCCETPLFIMSSRLYDATALNKPNAIYFYELENPPHKLMFRDNVMAGLEHGSSVIFVALQLAVWMGAQRIILYGIDHKFNLADESAECKGPVTDAGEQNHFISNYRKKGEKWYPPQVREIENAFQNAREFCEQRGIEVINCTRGGHLEIFKRTSLDAEIDKGRL